MQSQVLHTVWCNISGEAAGEIWHWSLLGVKGLINAAYYEIKCQLHPSPRFPYSTDNLDDSELSTRLQINIVRGKGGGGGLCQQFCLRLYAQPIFQH